MAKARVIDKWKMKKWYSVIAPDMFESREIGSMPADDDSRIMNRLVRISLGDVTGDLSQAYTLLVFRVAEVKGKTAYTRLVGHELSPSYLRSLVRRKRDIVNEVLDVTTKDGVQIRVKMSIYTARKASSPAKTAVRNAAHAEMVARAKEMDFATFEQEVIFGKFSSRIYKAIKKILPIKRIEVRKTEVKEQFAAA
ncbi:MAG: 30S ribosomal protein S3ae [Candidatus ainarchaeum sp.]|nr:30S ribosomal protein S3ae [Candidatus ainarchaeum sp.]